MKIYFVATFTTFTTFALLSNSSAQGQGKSARLEVSEKACPLEAISVPTADKHQARAVIRKPPGKGPFPAVILLHGGLGSGKDHKALEKRKRASRESPQYVKFLAAGYVTVNPMRRADRKDPQLRLPITDILAIVEHVKKMPEVDPKSIVVFGGSGGGNFALELAAETSLCAIAAGEPATVLFTGIWNKDNLALQTIMANPKRFYTPKLQRLTSEKIAKIGCPILIAHGDVHPLKKLNHEIFIPELKKAGKKVKVIVYPGEKHGFYWRATKAGSKVFDDCHAFFKKHLPTQPIPLKGAIVRRFPSPQKRPSAKPIPKSKTRLSKDRGAAVQLPDGVTVLIFDATVRKPIPFAKWTTGDIEPKPNQLVLLWVGISRSTGPVNVPSVSGAGIKWKLEKTLDVNGGPRRLCLFSGISTTPAKGGLTIDFKGQKQQRAFWAAIQFRDANSVRQLGIAPDSTARDGSGEVIFASPPIGPVTAFVMGSIRSDIVPPSGMFELGELNAVHRFEAAYSPKPQKQIQWTWQRGVHYLAIGAEICATRPVRGK